MAYRFDDFLKWVLVHEGGYVNHPKDPGGATNYGVIQRTYDAWSRRQGKPKRSVRHITMAEVEAIYRQQYWDVIKGDDLPSGLAYAVFDFAVNSGPRRAAKYLQRIVGAKADGWIGAETLAAVSDHPGGQKDIIIRLCDDRMRFLRGLRHWGTFGRGWTRRVMGDHDGIQVTDHGTVDRAMMVANEKADIPAPRHVPDEPIAKAEAKDKSISTSVKEALGDGAASKVGAGIAAGVGALSQLQGPIAYAVAGVIVIAALAGIVWLVRRADE